jgi:truncated hemoglobin YjbI
MNTQGPTNEQAGTEPMVTRDQRAGINTLPAEALLARMQATVDNLYAERDKYVGEQRMKYRKRCLAVTFPKMS